MYQKKIHFIAVKKYLQPKKIIFISLIIDRDGKNLILDTV